MLKTLMLLANIFDAGPNHCISKTINLTAEIFNSMTVTIIVKIAFQVWQESG